MEKLISGARNIGLALTPRQLEQFLVYYRELVAWNRRVNLTAIAGYEAVQTRHFLDSLTVSLALPEIGGQGALHLLDLGTGAGMPGVPLKILRPDIELVLLDSVAKKTAFLQHLVGCLGLEGVEVVTGRAEELGNLPQYREAFDAVTSRAVARLPALAELGLPLCRIGGLLIAQKKGDIDEEIERASRAIAVLGGTLREVKKVYLEELGEERSLVVIEKISPTPPGYPRRPGLPARRPLLSPKRAQPDQNI
ncbi:MAG: 16S rRNA (guanine(527)-N(7))-methyltransferase RsmG [Dehalococcoidia bacterium]